MKTKICGMTRQSDLEQAERLGFNLCGFIFHPASPRHIESQAAARLETGGMARVGVFVGQGAAEIIETMRVARLDYAQLHGCQTEQDAMRIGPERVIRVLWPERYASLAEMEAAARGFPCAAFLLDAGRQGGGSGESLAWRELADLGLPKPWFLAGGLNGENAGLAIKACRPWGLDFNSGLETAPGCKDFGKMAAALMAVKEMESR